MLFLFHLNLTIRLVWFSTSKNLQLHDFKEGNAELMSLTQEQVPASKATLSDLVTPPRGIN